MRSVTSRASRFDRAVDQITAVVPRSEFRLDEAAAPHRLAPSALALTVDRIDPDEPETSGRFVLLHDPDGVDEWGGSFRVVVFVRAELEADLLEDPLVYDVAWSWVRDALDTAGANAVQVGGTVTRNAGRSFGTMVERPADSLVEIRASWTPAEDAMGDVEDDLGVHVNAWLGLAAMTAGLAPIPQGVTPVGAGRRRGRR